MIFLLSLIAAIFLSSETFAFQIDRNVPTLRKNIIQTNHQQGSTHTLLAFSSCSKTSLSLSNSDPENNNNNNNSNNILSSNILNRFLEPRIDDIGLPLVDALFAQIIAPSFEIFYLSLLHAPRPSWITSIKSGTLLVPTLIHGAGLACCWLLGALSSKSYEYEAFDSGNYPEVIWRLVKGGSFAVGVLILATQLDLFVEYGGRIVHLGGFGKCGSEIVDGLDGGGE